MHETTLINSKMFQTPFDRFNALSSREKAICIAQDVLANLGAYRLKKGTYGRGDELQYDEGTTPEKLKTADLSEYVPRMRQACDVCLLGACLLSRASPVR